MYYFTATDKELNASCCRYEMADVCRAPETSVQVKSMPTVTWTQMEGNGWLSSAGLMVLLTFIAIRLCAWLWRSGRRILVRTGKNSLSYNQRKSRSEI